MWVIQNQALLMLPDDVPVPPESVKVTVPHDFLQNPAGYKIDGSKIVKLSAGELKAAKRVEDLKLTAEEIAKIKKAIKEGRI